MKRETASFVGMNVRYAILSSLLFLASFRCADINDTQKEPRTENSSSERVFSKDAPDLSEERDALWAGCPAPTHTGYATYYTWANGGGNCSFDPTPNDLFVGAMNGVDYAGSSICGATVLVRGPRGTVTIRIVDQCPECPEGNIDLSTQAFAQIADLPQGIVPIKWKLVPAAVQGNITFHFKEGSNQWWTAVQMRNHRYPVARFEYMTSQGTYKTVRRLSYNYFVEPTGMGPGPYTFRVTDIYGNVLVNSGIPHVENGNVTGANQFPLCSPVIHSHASDE